MQKTFITFCLLGLLSLSLVGTAAVLAQTDSTTWSTPVNLSRAGASTSPSMAVASSGSVFVTWEDAYAGTLFAQWDGEAWSEPAFGNFPFSGYPHLITGGQDQIHAWWIDSDGRLLYSRVTASSFAKPVAWDTTQLLAASAQTAAMAADGQGGVYVAFIRAGDLPGYPAGVYYRRSHDYGNTWSTPMLLFASPYLRNQPVGAAHITIASAVTGKDTTVYVAWDLRSRKQVWLARSLQNGLRWGDPVEIASPSAEQPVNPSHIQVQATGSNVLLIWQSAESESSCTQFFQSSEDTGVIWSEPQEMQNDLTGCATANQIIPLANGDILLFSNFTDQVYLSTWDSVQWSPPEPQTELLSLEDPETFDPVRLDSLQAGSPDGKRLFVAGSDASGAGDIWLRTREIASAEAQSTEAPLWSAPTQLAQVEGKISSLTLLPGSGEEWHAFWLSDQNGSSGGSQTALYYSHWAQGRWSTPNPLFTPSSGEAGDLDVALDASSTLRLVWSNPQGQILFSRADASRAYSGANWSEPQQVSAADHFATTPALVVGRDGEVYAAYVVPLNDQRGIYVAHSPDGGKTWEAPQAVVTGKTGSWQMLTVPQLALPSPGKLAIQWLHASLPGGSGPLGLYAAYSQDKGETWSLAEPVTEKPVTWSQIVRTGEHLLYRIWQVQTGSISQLNMQYSTNDGLIWSQPAGLPGIGVLEAGSSETSLVADPSGQMHLLQARQGDATQPGLLRYLRWQGESWVNEPPSDLPGLDLALGGYAAGLASDGRLMVVYTAPDAEDDQSGLTTLRFTTRLVSLPPAVPLPPTPTPSITPPSSPTPVTTPTPTPIPPPPDAPPSEPQLGPVALASPYSALAIGVALAVVLAALVFGVRQRMMNR